MSESEYLETRREAQELLETLQKITEEYTRISQEGGPGTAKLLRNLIQENEFRLREGILTLGNDPRLQQVILAEPKLNSAANNLGIFWTWLQDSGLVQSLLREPRQAKTKVPPEPAEHITGATVLEYLRSLREWLEIAAAELWGEENKLELPALGDRYAIGDFTQACRVANLLSEGAELKGYWIKLAECGAYWDTVPIGSSRAKLIYKGAAILVQLLNLPD